MHRIGIEFRIEREKPCDIDEGHVVCLGVFCEYPVLELRKPFDVAVAIWEHTDVEVLENSQSSHRVDHHAVAHHPDEGAKGELAADAAEVRADSVEIALDIVEADGKVRIGEIGVLFVETFRPNDLVVRLGPLPAIEIGTDESKGCLYSAQQCGPARGLLDRKSVV